MSLFEIFEIEGGSPGPRFLITAGVHGDEPEGMKAVRRLVDEIDASQLAGVLTLIPVVNESACSLDSRCGDDSLDLARTCPGSEQGSLTERVAAELTAQIQKADLYIDLHTGGKAVQLDPLVGYMLVPDIKVLETQRRIARAFNLPVVWGTSAELEGRSMSAARDAGVPAIYAEYLGGKYCSEAGVDAYVNGCLNVMIEFGMLSGLTQESPIPKLEVEDWRPDSGHLQINHPSPHNGVFEAAAKLGETIELGDELGRVNDTVICAAHSGRVICLRAIPEVDKGDSLGVILEDESAA